MFTQMDKKYIYGAVIGGVIVYLLLRKKKEECPACPKCGNGGISTLYPALVVPPVPAPAVAPSDAPAVPQDRRSQVATAAGAFS